MPEKFKILITAGPTREYLDPIRFISNPSSGKMGVALADEAISHGMNVTLIYGPGTANPPQNVRVINVETTGEMCREVVKELKNEKYDVFIAAAACADYRPVKKESGKIPSKKENLVIQLESTPKIIEEARKIDPNIFLCAFKAECNLSEKELIEKSYGRLKEIGLDLIIANDIGNPGCGFVSDTNEVYIIDAKRNITHIPLTTKREISAKIINQINLR